MKHSIIITAAFAALLSIASCERELSSQLQADGEGIRVTLTCGDVSTKTTQPGVGNENLIHTVDVFLFSNTEDEYRHHWRFSPEIESNFTCYIQAAVIADGTYKVYAIVNYPGPETDFVISSTNATLDQLQALALSESTSRTFTASSAAGITPAPNEDLTLVMTGIAEDITVHAVSGQTLVGNAEVNLSRVPAKVTMDFYLKDEVVNTKNNVTETWTPLTEGNNIRVYLCNGASEALVGGEKTDAAVFDYAPNLDNTAISGKADYSSAFSSTAFYTYPETWTYGASDEPYLKLIVPWKLVRSTSGIVQESQKEFYYKVMLPTNAFASNNWYHLSLDVTQLGGNADDDAVNVPCGYQVVDWRTGSEISSTMSPGYYLDVSVSAPDNIEFYGNTVDIPIFASGGVSIKSARKEWKNYTTSTTEYEDDTPDVSVAASGDYISITNNLDTDFNGTSYDISPYTYTIVLQLEGAGAAFDQTLVATQYPPLYVRQVQSDGMAYVYGYNFANQHYNNSSTTSFKFFDNQGPNPANNSSLSNSNMNHYIGTLTKPDNVTGSGTNNSRYILEVQATILDFEITIEGEVYTVVIGDPRSSTAVNFDGDFNTTRNSGPGLSSATYYPTDENSQYMISPRFRVASSYGKTGPLTYEGAKRRCAAYQENGYPAGRWRLPTAAEIEFLIKLSNDGKIISLFQPDLNSGYWAGGQFARFGDGTDSDNIIRDMSSYTAQLGTIDQPDGSTISGTNVMYQFDPDGSGPVGTKNNGVWARCVYDTWYWGSQTTLYGSGDTTPAYTSSNWLGFRTATPSLN